MYPICCKQFVNKYKVKRHISSEYERKTRFECNKCIASFASKYALNYHVKETIVKISIVKSAE